MTVSVPFSRPNIAVVSIIVVEDVHERAFRSNNNPLSLSQLKCHKYWPDEVEDYGDIAVKQLKCEHYADYSIRTFNVKRVSNVVRTVTALHVDKL